jgi:diguanylate cyclase (GGDEF)-like protein/PAS domain S-box-containing protein
MGHGPGGLAPANAPLVRSALDSIPHASILAFDRDLRFVIARGSVLDRFGYGENALEGRLASEALPADRWQMYEGAYRAALDGESTRMTNRSPDDSLVFEVRIDPVRGPDGSVIGGVSIATDVTELVTVKDRFRLLAENSSDVVVLIDADRTVRWVSQSVTRELGWAADELLGTRIFDLIHPDDAVWVDARRVNLWGSGGGDGGEVRFRDHSGGYRWMDAYAHVVFEDGGTQPAMVLALQAIDAEVAAREQLAQSERLFRAVIESAPIGMVLTDADGVIEFVNAAFCRLVLREESWLVGREAAQIIHPEPATQVDEAGEAFPAAVLSTEPVISRLTCSDGREVWVRQVAALVHDNTTGTDRRLLQVEDLTAEREARDALQQQALHDGLTGLRNRAWITDMMDVVLRTARREGVSVGVLMLDLDNFKVVNDSMGHAAGDEVLTVVADRLQSVLRPQDHVARLGGDEFCIVIPDAEGVSQVERVAERIASAIESEIVVHQHRVVPTASIGIAMSSRADTPQDLLRDADAALFAAKAAGRSRWQFADPTMHAKAMARITVEEELRRALVDGGLVVHYQPIVALADRAIIGHEALLRWQHPQRGLLTPAHFLSTAESSGLIVPIGQEVLDQVCALLATEPDLPGVISVNVSAVQFARADWADSFVETLELHGVAPDRLVVEVTETAAMSALDAVRLDLENLRALGVGVHVDDFGTGFSSIALLRDLPVTGVKLDQAFVRDLAASGTQPGTAVALSEGLAGLVRGLGLVGIAEGVETQEQCDVLRSHGWGYGQGYLFGHPQPWPAAVAGSRKAAGAMKQSTTG